MRLLKLRVSIFTVQIFLFAHLGLYFFACLGTVNINRHYILIIISCSCPINAVCDSLCVLDLNATEGMYRDIRFTDGRVMTGAEQQPRALEEHQGATGYTVESIGVSILWQMAWTRPWRILETKGSAQIRN